MYNDSEGSEDDERSSSSEEWVLRQIKENDPDTTILDCIHITHLTDEELEELGRDIANNTHLKHAYLWEDALNDRKASFLFRGLTRSASITIMHFNENGLSVAGVRSMVPFLQNANNLHHLYLDNNNIQSEGFNELFRALRYSPVEALSCDSCGIESIDVDNDYFPRHLTYLNLNSNVIDADGCHGIAKLMQGGDSTLKNLWLNNNKINDEGVGILVDALQNNTSLTALSLSENYGISKHGMTILLKLVNDISCIQATLGSNHTLSNIFLSTMQAKSNADKEFETHIDMASDINRKYKDELETAGREKVIQTQLHSARRAKLADLQGVNHLVYSEINPLHLPEVLSLVGRRHGHGELYVALKSSIAGVISTVNRKEFIRQQRDYHLAKAEQLNAELAAIEAAEGDTVHVGNESHSNKRRRK